MAARSIKFAILIFLTFFLGSCAELFKSTIPYSQRQNYLLELQREQKIIESLEDKLPPSDVDMALRLNITLQNAIKEGREPRYVLFLYRIYSQKLSALLESLPSGNVYSPPEEKMSKPQLPQQSVSTPQIKKSSSQASAPSPATVSTSETAPPSAPSCEFDKAMDYYNNQEWDSAYMEFQKCIEAGENIDEAGKYLKDIEDRVILPEWNRANLLVYQGRSESDPERKKEFLEKAEDILKELLEKYPNNRYSPRIEKNIELIEKLLSKIQG